MRSNVHLIEPAAKLDWWRFRKEGDAYLKRIGASDDVALWAAAKLYLLNWLQWKKGKRWNRYRLRWEKELTFKIGQPQVFDTSGEVLLDVHGRPLPACMAPKRCECGAYCAPTAKMCLTCWQRVRPRKPGNVAVSTKHQPYLAHMKTTVSDERDGAFGVIAKRNTPPLQSPGRMDRWKTIAPSRKSARTTGVMVIRRLPFGSWRLLQRRFRWVPLRSATTLSRLS